MICKEHVVPSKDDAIIVKWTEITETEEIPPMGDKLTSHFLSSKGAKRQASCSAWNLLYQTLLDNGLSLSTVAFTDTGKPFFLDYHIHFSISHSKSVCAVAISDHPVGVDVEVIKDSYNPHLIERSLNENEKAVFDRDFTRLWCRKEAVAKMTGDGITGYPSYIDTTKYEFEERKLEYDGLKYWLIAVKETSDHSTLKA